MSNLIVYFSIVIPLGAILLWLAKRHITRVDNARRKSVFGRKGFESIKTHINEITLEDKPPVEYMAIHQQQAPQKQ
ncbi:MAG: hypothetical protein K9J27_07275 [Bacteroidales bacterium]|nr:hypothetical protein [Bacteroidales bacterium]MCF8332556.1 hypothetical protein [Bacteroidales bacterium]